MVKYARLCSDQFLTGTSIPTQASQLDKDPKVCTLRHTPMCKACILKFKFLMHTLEGFVSWCYVWYGSTSTVEDTQSARSFSCWAAAGPLDDVQVNHASTGTKEHNRMVSKSTHQHSTLCLFVNSPLFPFTCGKGTYRSSNEVRRGHKDSSRTIQPMLHNKQDQTTKQSDQYCIFHQIIPTQWVTQTLVRL